MSIRPPYALIYRPGRIRSWDASEAAGPASSRHERRGNSDADTTGGSRFDRADEGTDEGQILKGIPLRGNPG